MYQKQWTDPKEAMVGLDGLQCMVQQLHKISRNEEDNNNTCTDSDTSNRQQINEYQLNMNIDERAITSIENQNPTPQKRGRNLIDGDGGTTQSPKTLRTSGVFGNKDQNGRGPLVIRNQKYHLNDQSEKRNQNQQQKQNNNNKHTTAFNNENIDFHNYDINEQSISYAFETHLQPIVIECQPKLHSKEIATKLVSFFFKEIEKDFRQQYPNHRKPLGFDHWWQDADGTYLFGETKDVDLFIFLCDEKRYPAKIETIKITPNPPKRLPPQHTVVIKFVRNDIETDEIRREIKERYESTFTVENMIGTMRSNSRHIRVDFTEKKDYNSILNSGVIGIQGQLFNVDEYLPAPKILICTRCNQPGHVKKQCQLSFEKCRRCGEDRLNGNDHKICPMKCQHCGSKEHCSNDYRCPSLLHFRRQIVSEIRKRPNCLPAQVQLFIPVDCRPSGNSNRILSNPNPTTQKVKYLPTPDTIQANEWPNLPGRTHRQQMWDSSILNKQTIFDQTIKSFSNEISELRQKYLDDQRKIEQRFQEQIKNIQNGWLAIQNQVSTQNEMITTTCTLIKDILFDSCLTFTNMMVSLINELKNNARNGDDKQRLELMDEHIKLMTIKISDKKESYHHFQEQLNILMSQQRVAAISIMNSLFTTTNV